jgi:hypothetical protein
MGPWETSAAYAPKMSNPFEQSLKENEVTLQTASNVAAIQQRNHLIAEQKATRAEMERQRHALEAQNRIEKDRARTEKQRLEIERQRLDAENAERELRRLQTDQIKQLRNLIAGLDADLTRFRRQHLEASR